ncbi:hypothetical protein SLE2022_178070 [Rubroshorea leprosula]
MDAWPGLQMHSHNHRGPEPFQNQIVVLIGNGPSARDILKELSPVAREVHQAIRELDSGLKKLENLDNAWQHPMDGSAVSADVIVHYTGYRYHFPFLRTNGIVTVDDNRVGPLYQHVFPPSLALRLSFLRLPNCAESSNRVTGQMGSKDIVWEGWVANRRKDVI